MAKKEIEHKDIIDQPVKIGDVVAVARGNQLSVCKVAKISPKKIRVVTMGAYKSDFLIYSSDCVKLDGPDAMAYVLRHG